MNKFILVTVRHESGEWHKKIIPTDSIMFLTEAEDESCKMVVFLDGSRIVYTCFETIETLYEQIKEAQK